MNSKQKGSLAEAQCIAKMYEKGWEVSLPIGDRKPYDMIVDDGANLRKVQCKYAGKNPKGKHIACLRITGGNQSFNTAKHYKDDDFDLLYIYTEDKRHFLILWESINNTNTIDIDSPKFESYRI